MTALELRRDPEVDITPTGIRLPARLRAPYLAEVTWRRDAVAAAIAANGGVVPFGPIAVRPLPAAMPRAGRCLTCGDEQEKWNGGMCILCVAGLRAALRQAGKL